MHDPGCPALAPDTAAPVPDVDGLIARLQSAPRQIHGHLNREAAAMLAALRADVARLTRERDECYDRGTLALDVITNHRDTEKRLRAQLEAAREENARLNKLPAWWMVEDLQRQLEAARAALREISDNYLTLDETDIRRIAASAKP
jgi:hypothetical protein